MRPFLWICRVLLGLLILLVLLPLAASRTPQGAVLEYLPFGWWLFLKRNIPQLTINWSLIGTGLICSVLVIALGNWLLGAMFGQFQRASGAGMPPRRWPWRWTICIYCGIWLLFTIAFGAAGIMRHATWLMEYRQPWYQERLNYYSEFRMVDGLLQQLLMENNDDLECTRKAFGSQKSYRGQTPMTDDFNVIFYGDKSNKVSAYLIIPRNPQLAAKGRFGAATPGTNDLARPMSELQQTIKELDASYPVRGL